MDNDRLRQIGFMIFPAALQKHGRDQTFSNHVRDVDRRVSLGDYFVKLIEFVMEQPRTYCAAARFKAELNEPDALEIVFLDALPFMEARKGILALSEDETRLLRIARAAVGWYQEQAYRNAPIIWPANDHFKPISPPTH